MKGVMAASSNCFAPRLRAGPKLRRMKAEHGMRKGLTTVMAAVLMAGLFGNPLAAQTLDDLQAQFQKNCEHRKEQLKQDKEKIEQAAQAPTTSPEQRAQATQAIAALDKVITTTTKMLEDPALRTSGEAQKAILAQVQSAIVYGNIVASSTESSLGIPRSGLADHVVAVNVDIEGLLTKVSRFDGSATYIDSDGNFTGSGIGNPFFGMAANSPVQVAAAYTPSTAESAAAIVAQDKSVGGGVMLEDAAGGLGQVSSVTYDDRYNALVMDDRLIYFIKVAPWDAAALCLEISRDKNTLVGVSMGTKVFMFGDDPSTYENSDVGHTLLLTDHFLGDIVFGSHEWTQGYNFPDGYQPKAADIAADMLVRFAFKTFQFAEKNNELQLANLAFDVTMMPVAKEPAKNGGMLPDYDALKRGYAPPPEFLANTQYITSHFDNFFRRERIVAKTIAYGELAALFRSYKQAGLNLEALALELESG